MVVCLVWEFFRARSQAPKLVRALGPGPAPALFWDPGPGLGKPKPRNHTKKPSIYQKKHCWVLCFFDAPIMFGITAHARTILLRANQYCNNMLTYLLFLITLFNLCRFWNPTLVHQLGPTNQLFDVLLALGHCGAKIAPRPDPRLKKRLMVFYPLYCFIRGYWL